MSTKPFPQSDTQCIQICIHNVCVTRGQRSRISAAAENASSSPRCTFPRSSTHQARDIEQATRAAEWLGHGCDQLDEDVPDVHGAGHLLASGGDQASRVDDEGAHQHNENDHRRPHFLLYKCTM